MSKTTSHNFSARQRARRDDGRYADMHRCEFCNVPLGDGYFSLSDCNTTGIGLVCCRKCCNEKEPPQ